MRTVIIDNSLCCIVPERPPEESGVDAEFKSYASCIFQSGAEYMEITKILLPYFHNVKLDDHYILRLIDPSDIELLEVFNFAYVTVPLRLAYLIPQIELPIILELNVSKVNPIEMLKLLMNKINLTPVSMIRLVGDFKLSDADFISMLRWYKARVSIPFDICPLNTSLTGMSTAMMAYQHKADSITMCFGDGNFYTSLDEFLVFMHSMHGVIISKDYLNGLCKASIWINIISQNFGDKAAKLIHDMSRTPSYIVNIDNGTIKAPQRKKDGGKKRVSVAEKSVSDFELEPEIADELLEIIKNSGLYYPDNDDKNKLN